MTIGPSNERLDRIEADLERLTKLTIATAEAMDRQVSVNAELRSAQLSATQQLEEAGSLISNLTVRLEQSIEQAELDRAEIQRIWQYLREGRNGHSNGNGGEE